MKTFQQVFAIFGAFFAGVIGVIVINQMLERAGIILGSFPKTALAAIPLVCGWSGNRLVKKAYALDHPRGFAQKLGFGALIVLGILGTCLVAVAVGLLFIE